MSPASKPHLSVRLFTPDDMPLIDEWVKARDTRSEPPAWLPKALGVVIDDESGPSCALFAMECFRVPFCFLDYPVSRPGMSRRESVDRFEFAVHSLIQLAGKCCEPQAQFTEFVCYANGPMALILSGMGFHDAVGMPQHVMQMTIPPPPPPIPAP